MKKYVFVLFSILSFATLMAFTGDGGNDVHNNGGAPAGFAGDPAGGGQTCRACHSGPSLPPLTGVITSNIPSSGYIPNTTYTITAVFVRPGHTRFGFSISPQSSSGVPMGSLTALSGTMVNGAGQYVTHVAGSTIGSGSKTWNFTWTSPAPGSGNVTFYGAFNAANNNGQASGDSIFLSTLTVSENTTGLVDMAGGSLSLDVYPNPASEIVNIRFFFPEKSEIKMTLLDVNGNKVTDLTDGNFHTGQINHSFSVAAYPKGVYFLRISANGNFIFKKIVKF